MKPKQSISVTDASTNDIWQCVVLDWFDPRSLFHFESLLELTHLLIVLKQIRDLIGLLELPNEQMIKPKLENTTLRVQISINMVCTAAA